MAWKVYGESLEPGDLSGTRIKSTAVFEDNTIVKAVRTCVILFGNPTYSNLQMKCFDNNDLDDTPSNLKATSINSFQPGDLLETQAYGMKFIYFEFTPFGVRAGDKYHFTLSADGYLPTDNSFMAWRNIWPDPIYTEGISAVSVINSPIMISGVIGSKL